MKALVWKFFLGLGAVSALFLLGVMLLLLFGGPLGAKASDRTIFIAFAGCLIETEARQLSSAVVQGETLMPGTWPSCRALIPFLAKSEIGGRAVSHYQDTEGNPFFLAFHKSGPLDPGIWVLIWDFSHRDVAT